MDHLGTLLTLNARRAPDRIAIRMFDGPSITYGALDRRSTKLANALLGSGMRPGERIGAWLGDCIEYVEVYFAAAKAGLLIVPINDRFKTEEARFQVQRTGARGLVFWAPVAPYLAGLLPSDDLKLLVGIGEGARDIYGVQDYENLLDRGGEMLPPPPDENSAFSICFTSGTTGFPKGATLSHRGLKNVARTQAVALRLPMRAVNLQVASMAFPATFGSHICSHMYVGGTTVLLDKREKDATFLMRAIEQEGVSHFYLPTPLLRDFTALCARDRSRWRSLASVLHAGSRADPQILAGLADVIQDRYLEGWGMSEVSGGIATATSTRDLLYQNHAREFFASVGHPVPDTVIEIVDENRNPVPHDGETVGELALHSSSVMLGYWGDEEASRQSLRDGWYYSGDLGRIDEAGYIYIVDRRPDLIVSGGMNIYPAELERVIQGLPDVVECAVVAGPHERWGQTPVAYVVCTPGTRMSAEHVINAFSDKMAGYKKPTRIEFIDRLPRHPTTDKILRTVLRALAHADQSK